MSTYHEVERLQAVYHTYRKSRAVQARWAEHNPGNRAIVRERTRKLKQILFAANLLPLTHHRILDVGCGTGEMLSSLTRWGARPSHLYGVDLLPERIALAQQQFPEIHFLSTNAEQLDFADDSFDLVLLFTVFTSILNDRMASNVAKDVRRVLKPGGGVVWYDFRYHNPNNVNVRGMSEQAIRHLFPNFNLCLHPITLLPPLARRLGWGTPILYPTLALIPWLRTHYLGLLLKLEM